MFERDESKSVELTPELAALERRLAGLELSPVQIDRDRLMFEAGRAAARPGSPGYVPGSTWAGGWFWPAAAAMATASSVVLGAMLVWRPDAMLVVERDAKPQAVGGLGTEIGAPSVERQAVLPEMPNWAIGGTGGYLQERYIALTRGVGELQFGRDDGVSSESGGSAQPVTARDLLRELAPGSVLPAPNS